LNSRLGAACGTAFYAGRAMSSAKAAVENLSFSDEKKDSCMHWALETPMKLMKNFIPQGDAR